MLPVHGCHWMGWKISLCSSGHGSGATTCCQNHIHWTGYGQSGQKVYLISLFRHHLIRTNAINLFKSWISYQTQPLSVPGPVGSNNPSSNAINGMNVNPFHYHQTWPCVSPTRVYTRQTRTSNRRTLKHWTLGMESLPPVHRLERIIVSHPRIDRGTWWRR